MTREVGVKVDGAAERSEPVLESKRQAERRGSSRARGDPASSGTVPRATDDARRKRAPERRYTGWGDEIERAFCVRTLHQLPAGFPVSSRTGVATIPAVVVARRPDALLLCRYDHFGPHVWPDGETVEEPGSREEPGATVALREEP